MLWFRCTPLHEGNRDQRVYLYACITDLSVISGMLTGIRSLHTHEGVTRGGGESNACQPERRQNLLTVPMVTIFSFSVSASREIPSLEWINYLDIYLRPSFPTSEAFEEGVVGLSPPPVTCLNKFYLWNLRSRTHFSIATVVDERQ